MSRTLLLIVNQKAGKTRSSQPLLEAAERFCADGWLLSLRFTRYPGHAAEIAAKEGMDFDAVVCCGGDGTLSETVGGLMALDAPPPLGYLPGGSTNDFAASLGLCADPVRNAGIITSSGGRRLDIGTLNGRPFVYVASFGAFTRASYAAPQSAKNDLGHLAYILEGAKDLSSLRPYRVRAEAGDEVFEGDFLFGAVTNATSVGGLVRLPPENVVLDDGLFELTLIRMPESFQELQDLIRCLATQTQGESLIFRHVPSARFLSGEEFPWTLDGEYCPGAGEIEIANHRERLTFLL